MSKAEEIEKKIKELASKNPKSNFAKLVAERKADSWLMSNGYDPEEVVEYSIAFDALVAYIESQQT